MAVVSGTFANGQSVFNGNPSGALVIPSGKTAFKLTLGGDIDGANTVKAQSSGNNGLTWADGDTYNSAQVDTSVAAVAGTHWRLVTVAGQANKVIHYKMSVES